MQRAGRILVETLEHDLHQLSRCRSRSSCFHALAFPWPTPPPPQINEGFNSRHDMGTFGFARAPLSSPSLAFTESGMHAQGFQLMAVPKRKVTPSRKRIRNAPKALKPAPLIIRCKSCGRIKLPHFFCCTGDKIIEEDGSTK